eukprot:2422263-Prymnesium_polylepis.1
MPCETCKAAPAGRQRVGQRQSRGGGGGPAGRAQVGVRHNVKRRRRAGWLAQVWGRHLQYHRALVRQHAPRHLLAAFDGALGHGHLRPIAALDERLRHQHDERDVAVVAEGRLVGADAPLVERLQRAATAMRGTQPSQTAVAAAMQDIPTQQGDGQGQGQGHAQGYTHKDKDAERRAQTAATGTPHARLGCSRSWLHRQGGCRTAARSSSRGGGYEASLATERRVGGRRESSNLQALLQPEDVNVAPRRQPRRDLRAARGATVRVGCGDG